MPRATLQCGYICIAKYYCLVKHSDIARAVKQSFPRQLDVLDLAKAVADGRANGSGVRVARHTFLPHDELEGWRQLDGGRSLFVISSRTDNIVVGTIRTVEPRKSPVGTGR